MATQQRRKPKGRTGEAKAPPVQKFRAGRLQADVWAQQNEQGAWHNVTFKRNYKDDAGAWQSSDSFGREDLLALAELARQAWAWILEQRAHDRGANGQVNGTGHPTDAPNGDGGSSSDIPY